MKNERCHYLSLTTTKQNSSEEWKTSYCNLSNKKLKTCILNAGSKAINNYYAVLFVDSDCKLLVRIKEKMSAIIQFNLENTSIIHY